MGVIESVYNQFLEAVAEGRNMDIEAVREIADGRILSGRQAMDHGLVDHMGNLQDAIDLAAQMAGIRGKPNVIYPRRRPSIMDFLLENVVVKLIEGLRRTNQQLYYKAPPVSSF